MPNDAHDPGSSIPAKVRPAYDAIVRLIEDFARQYLNDEYLVLCRRMAGVLARKRPSPIVSGKPESWACGIIRAVGWANFLDDPSQTPHVKMTQVDQLLGVSTATGQAKSKAVRDLLKMRPFDPEWTLPNRMDDNPMAWLVQVNGLIVDVRSMPREVQEEAYRQGLIPYLPEPKVRQDDQP